MISQMIYQITLMNIDLGQQLGSLKDQLEKTQSVIFKSPLFSAAHQKSSLSLELFVQRPSNQHVILVFNGLVLQDSASNPFDEIHAWLSMLFKSVNLPFTVQNIGRIAGNTFKPDPRIFTHVSTSTLTRPEKAQPSVIPGIQMLCIRHTAYDPDTPIQTITAVFDRFIKYVATRQPIQVSKNDISVNFPNIYVHSCTHKAVIFILPYDKTYNRNVVNDMAADLINTLLTEATLPYRVANTFFKPTNCFSPPYTETKNSTWIDRLDTENPISEKFYCALSAQVMDEPVQLPDTPQVVERSAIEFEIKLRGINPYNRNPLTEAQLIPCPELKSQINDHVHSMIRSRIQRGTHLFKENKFEQAIHDFSSVISYCSFHSSLKPQQHSIVLNNLACCYRNMMDYSSAIKYFHLALLHDLKSHAPHQQKAKHLKKLADVYLTMRLPEIAKKYFTFARKAFINDGNHEGAEGINLSLDQCKSLSELMGSSFEREPKSLHSMCVNNEKSFHTGYHELARTITPPKGPFVIFSNDYNDIDSECSVVPYRYELVLNKPPSSLEDIHQSYDVKDVSKKVLLAVIRDLKQPCLSASCSFEKNDQGIVIKVNILVTLYLPRPTQGQINPQALNDNILTAINKRVKAFMPKIDTSHSTGTTKSSFHSARAPMLFSQPKTLSVQAGDIEVTIYTFANCLQVDDPSKIRSLSYILKTFSCELSVSTNLKDHEYDELPILLSRLNSHIREHGKTNNHPDRREILRELAHLHHQSDNADNAIRFYRQVITIDRAILSELGNSLTSHLLLACDLIQLGKLYQQQGNHSRAFNCFKEAHTAYQQGEIEEPAAVTKLREMIDQQQSTAEQHASQAMIQFFKRPSADNKATSGSGAAPEAANLC
jgi:tetratricopeptide (TPR) repeat protein